MQHAFIKHIAVIALLILQLGVAHELQHDMPTDISHSVHSEADCLLADTAGAPLRAAVAQAGVYVLPICRIELLTEAKSTDLPSDNWPRAPPMTF